MHACAIALPRFIEHQGAGLLGYLHGSVGAVVADHDHTPDQWMRVEVLDRSPDAALVVVSRQGDSQEAVAWGIIADPLLVSHSADVAEQIPTDKNGADRQRNSAVPDEGLIEVAKSRRVQEHPA